MMMSSGRGRYASQRALSKILDRTSRRCGLASALIQLLPAQPDRTDLRPESVRLQLVRQARGLQRRCGVRFRPVADVRRLGLASPLEVRGTLAMRMLLAALAVALPIVAAAQATRAATPPTPGARIGGR